MMEVFAGFLTQAGHRARAADRGPVALGELDSTLITVTSGNRVKDALSDETEADEGEH